MKNERLYFYYHITIQPKSCDGNNFAIDYLTQGLIENYRKLFLSLSKKFAYAIETNKDNSGHHLHCAIELNRPRTQSDLYKYLYELIENEYILSEGGYKRAIKALHKTKKQFGLCAGGYLSKQFKTIKSNPNYFSIGFSDEELNNYKSEHIELKELKEKKSNNNNNTDKNYSKQLDPKHILDKNKYSPDMYLHYNSYFKALVVILEKEPNLKINFVQNFEKIYNYILEEYQIGFVIQNKKRFDLMVLQFSICKNINSQKDTDTLVNFIRFKNEPDMEQTYTSKGTVQTYLNKYWSIE